MYWAMPYPQRCSPLRNVVFHIGAFRHNIIRLTARVADKPIVLAKEHLLALTGGPPSGPD
jgi:hypothetical protein